MNVTFAGKLNIDKSFYSLKRSNCDEIYNQTKKIIESPVMQKIIPQDIKLTGKPLKKGDMITIHYGDVPIEIVSKGEIKPVEVINQIFIMTCFEHGKRPKNALFKNVYQKILEIIKENQV